MKIRCCLWLLFFGLLLVMACRGELQRIHPYIPEDFRVFEKYPYALSFRWTAASDPNGSIATYHVSYRKKGQSDYSAEKSMIQLECTLGGLTAETTYDVRLRVKDEDGYYSDYITLEVATLALPMPPTHLVLSDKTRNTLSFRWYPATDLKGSVASYHFAYRKKGMASYSAEKEITQPAYTLTDLTSATTYEVRVRVQDNAGSYSDYVTLEVMTIATPTTPTLFVVTKRMKSSLSFRWHAAIDLDGSVASYHLSYRKKGVGNYSVEMATTQPIYTLTGLVPTTTYEVRVRTQDNEGHYSEYATLEVMTLALPTTPSGFVVYHKTRGSISFRWKAANDLDGYIENYYVSYRKKDKGSYSNELQTTNLEHTLSGLDGATTYQVRIRAQDNEGYYSDYALLEVWTLFDFTYGGRYSDRAHAITSTSDGGFILAGTYTIGLTYDDIWVVKIDSQGNKVWHKTFGGKRYSDQAHAITSTSDGGFILTGYTTNNAGYSDIWVVKIDSQGDELWRKTYGEDGYHDKAYAVAMAADGGYLLAGSTASKSSGGYSDMWIVKIDAVGNKVWDKTFGGKYVDVACGVAVTKDNGCLLAGYTYSKGAGASDMWVVKLDSKGDKIWDKTFGGRDSDAVYAITVSIDGGYILAGVTNSQGVRNFHYNDMWVVKIDEAGDKVWDTNLERKDADGAKAITTTADGGYILVGYAESKSPASDYDDDMWVVKIDSKGNKVWDKTFGGSGDDQAYAVTTIADGGYLVVGTTRSKGAGKSDMWVIKIDGAGNL